MRCACIDIGSNTTRLLVAERDPVGGAGLRELATERAFTAIGAAAGPDGTLPAAKIAEVAAVVAAQAATARRHGAESVHAVATAAIRRAPNGFALGAALAGAGIELHVLTGEQEARLAFAGAIATLADPPVGAVVVVDVGGGSTEVAIGRAGSDPWWWASLPVGSSSLTRACVRQDPPSSACVGRLAAAARDAFAAIAPPAPAQRVELGLAVGGSATSLALLAHWPEEALDERSLRRAQVAVCAASVAETAARMRLLPERVRVLPAGISLLAAASRAFATPLRVARGGLREGVVLELLGRGPA